MPSFSPDDTNKFNVTVARQVEINQRLIEKGLVSKYCRDVYYWNKGNAFFPKPEYYVDILFELLDKHPRWLSFMTRYAQSDTIASYLMEMCKTLLGLTDKKVELPEFQYYEEMSVRDLIFILAQAHRLLWRDALFLHRVRVCRRHQGYAVGTVPFGRFQCICECRCVHNNRHA